RGHALVFSPRACRMESEHAAGEIIVELQASRFEIGLGERPARIVRLAPDATRRLGPGGLVVGPRDRARWRRSRYRAQRRLRWLPQAVAAEFVDHVAGRTPGMTEQQRPKLAFANGKRGRAIRMARAFR